MTVKIEIVDGKIDERSGTSSAEKGSRPFRIREQRAYAHVGNPYPFPVVLGLEDNHTGYAPGWYDLDGSSFQVGRFGNLELTRKLVLRPCAAPKANAA